MRLTNKERDEVIRNAVQATIEPRRKALAESAGVLASAVVTSKMTKAEREWLANAPKGVSLDSKTSTKLHYKDNEDSTVYWDDNLNPSRLDRAVNRWGSRVSITQPVTVLPEFSHDYDFEAKNKDHVRQLKGLIAAYEQLRHDHAELRKVVQEAIYACNTRNQVKERYPDLVKFLPPVVEKTKGLAVTSDKVHETLACAKKGGCE